MAAEVSKLVVGVNTDTTGASAQLGALGGLMRGLTTPAGIATAGFLAAGAAVTAVGIMSTRMAANFQEGMTTLVTGAGESKDNLKLVSDGMLKLAVDTGSTTKQLTDGMFMIESAGYHGKAGLTVLSDAAKGAKVGAADLGTVADATTTIMKDFGDTGVTSANAVNMLIATVASGKTHMQDLAGAMAMILPTASAARIKLTDVMGAMATMTGEGVPAANAATYLRQTLIMLTAPGAAAAKALEEVGLKSSDVAVELQKSLPDALKMITDAVGKKFPEGSAQYVEALKAISGGSKTMQGMLDLTGQHMSDFVANVNNIATTTQKAGNQIQGWGMVQDDFNFKMQKLHAIFETLMIQLGTKLLPVLSNVADFFAGHLATGLAFVTSHLNIFIPLVGGLLVVGLYTAAAAMWALITPVLIAAAPVIAIGLAIGALAAALKYAWDHNARFRDIVMQVGKVAVQVGGWIKDNLVATIQLMIPYVRDIIAHVQVFAGELSNRLGPAGVNVGRFLGAAFEFIKWSLGQLFGLWQDIWPAMSAILSGFWNIIKGVIEIGWAVVSNTFKFWLDVLGGNWKGAWNDIKDMFKGIWDGIKQVLTGALQVMGGMVLQFVSGVLSVLSGVPGPLGDMARDALKHIQNISDQLSQIGADAGGSYANGLASQQSIVEDAATRLAESAARGMGAQHHYATGGIAQYDQIALVGEHGPETVFLPQGARVVPGVGRNAPGILASSLAGDGGSPVIYVQAPDVHLDGRKVSLGTLPHMSRAYSQYTGNRRGS